MNARPKIEISHSGPAYRFVREALTGVAPYERLRTGHADRATYCRLIDQGALSEIDLGITEDQLNVSARHCLEEEAFVDMSLRAMVEEGLIPTDVYPREEFAEFRAVIHRTYRHDGQVTFVYPEEERLLFALSHVLAPASSVALGSFYGYAAVWLLPGIVAAGGVLSLVDVDPDAMALAEANVDALGYRDHARFEIADATRWTATEQVDLCFLDAEGPKDGVSPDLRDKAVYGPVLEQAAAKIRPGGLLVAHNVLEDDLPRTRFLSERVRSYRDQQRRFRAELERSFDRTAVLATTEGMGVYRRGRDC